MPPPQQIRALIKTSLRIVGVIQGLIAFAVLVSFLFFVWEQYAEPYYWRSEYDFM